MSLAFLGASIVSVVAGIIINKIGRKLSILVGDGFFIIGSLIEMIAVHVLLLYFGRFLIGCAIGLSAIASQVYLSESAPNVYRG